MFRTSYVITLQHPVEYYNDEREFPIRLSAVAITGGVRRLTGYTIPACDPTLAEQLRKFQTATYRCSLVNLAEAAMRFYQDGRLDPHAPLIEYERARFLLLHEWDQIFGINGSGSVAHLRSEVSQRHSESLTKPTEMLGYGLAIVTVAHVFGLPPQRFSFLNASGKRPDFTASINITDLLEEGGLIQFLLDRGTRIFLEVKTRTTGNRKITGNFPIDLLEDLDRKRTEWIRNTEQLGQFLGAYVAIPKPNRWPDGKAWVVLADPGNKTMLNENQQAEFILREIVSLAYRYGMWQTMQESLNWIKELGFSLSENEEKFRTRTFADDKFATLLREIDGRHYRGRIFSEVIYALNKQGDRGMTQGEAEDRLYSGDMGINYFCGIDERLRAMITDRNLQGLLTFGLREPTPNASSATASRSYYSDSGFIRQEEPIKPDEWQEIRSELETALKHW